MYIAYNFRNNCTFEPPASICSVLSEGRFLIRLPGISFDGEIILEILLDTVSFYGEEN
jgi:hypothetical protein